MNIGIFLMLFTVSIFSTFAASPPPSAPPPSASASPTPVRIIAPTAYQAKDAGLDKLNKALTEEYINKVSAPVQAQKDEIEKKYLAALEHSFQVATTGGKLEEAVALRDEKKRVVGGGVLPAVDPPNTPQSLVTYRNALRKEMDRIETQGNSEAKVVLGKHIQILENYMRELTTHQNLEAALEVKQRVDELKTSSSALVPKVEGSGQPSPQSGSDPVPGKAKADPLVGKTISFPHERYKDSTVRIEVKEGGDCVWIGLGDVAVDWKYERKEPKVYHFWSPGRESWPYIFKATDDFKNDEVSNNSGSYKEKAEVDRTRRRR